MNHQRLWYHMTQSIERILKRFIYIKLFKIYPELNHAIWEEFLSFPAIGARDRDKCHSLR